MMPDSVSHRHLAVRLGHGGRLRRARHAVVVIDSPLAPLHRVSGSRKPGGLRGHVRRRGSIRVLKPPASSGSASAAAPAPGPARDHNLLRDIHRLPRPLGAGLTLRFFGFALLARHPLL